VPKNGGLARPLQAALLALMKNGQYKAILTHWGVQPGAIPPSKVKVNGAIS
jgi:polar amino acid transport system substrate-binding protein